MCFSRNATRGAWVLKPKALSERSTVWRFWRGRSAVRREESAGGISERRREVKISAKIAVRRVDFSRKTEARYVQAETPRVLPPR